MHLEQPRPAVNFSSSLPLVVDVKLDTKLYSNLAQSQPAVNFTAGRGFAKFETKEHHEHRGRKIIRSYKITGYNPRVITPNFAFHFVICVQVISSGI